MSESLYDAVGEGFFTQLTEDFYRHLATTETVFPMYPADLTEAKAHLRLFLVQYWGGPSAYQERRGHPRLRQRHAPFRITKRARDEWLGAMIAALDDQRSVLSDDQYDELVAYFTMAAHQLRNV